MSVTVARGFVAAGAHVGIKASGDPDLSLVATDDGRPVAAAAVFTSNLMTAPPVLVCRDHLAATGGQAAAVILNSGNANAATGARGRDDAERMCAATASALGCEPAEVLVCSTGLIGYRLPIDTIEAGTPALVAARAIDGAAAAAEAIRTTDTVRKESVVRGDGVVVGAMAKGAAMLAPHLATMLAVLTTDAAAEPSALQAALADGVAGSFNTLSIDGATSTNDTVILLASGRAGPVDQITLSAMVAEVCGELAALMAGDAEGATKIVRVRVQGAASDDEAATAARKVGESQLVKCSWYGGDPYWGRIASELGSAGVAFDPDRLSVRYGPHLVAAAGVDAEHDRAALADYLTNRQLEITADLGVGPGAGTLLTNDLTHAYIDENMTTS